MTAPLRLFEAYGIEVESMVVDAETLDVSPVVDELLRDAAGGEEFVGDVEDGPIAWSNEFVAHVVERKTNGPAPGWRGLADAFAASDARIERLLAARGARLLPTGMHPWMDPTRETQFWPHDNGPVYAAYHRLFDARRHGWANLQSVHLNLPFAGDEEFARLHAAVRVVLPLIPALAASTPFVEGRATGLVDNRLEHYRTNSERCASMTGLVIPEDVADEAAYRAQVLAPIDRELVARGADEVLLGNEWTNARGAIARFDRGAIEVRLIDSQECPAADLAVAAAVSGFVRAMVEERWCSRADQRAFATEALAEQLRAAIAAGSDAAVTDPRFAAAFGVGGPDGRTIGGIVRARAAECFDGSDDLRGPLDVVLEHGELSRRLLRAAAGDHRREALRALYREVADRGRRGESFRP